MDFEVNFDYTDKCELEVDFDVDISESILFECKI